MVKRLTPQPRGLRPRKGWLKLTSLRLVLRGLCILERHGQSMKFWARRCKTKSRVGHTHQTHSRYTQILSPKYCQIEYKVGYDSTFRFKYLKVFPINIPLYFIPWLGSSERSSWWFDVRWQQGSRCHNQQSSNLPSCLVLLGNLGLCLFPVRIGKRFKCEKVYRNVIKFASSSKTKWK